MTRGTLTLPALEIRPVGLGALLARLEQLKEMLAAEGLFDAERKKPLPFLPRGVGLICGRESAAERDVVENARRRWPAVTFDIREVAVQGTYAVGEVIDALRELDRRPRRRRHRHRARRRRRGGPAAVLRRGAVPRGRGLPHAGRLARSATSRTRRCSTTSPTGARRRPTDAGKRVVPDVARGARPDRRRCAARPGAASTGASSARRQWLAARTHTARAGRPVREVERADRATSPATRDRARRVVAACLDRHGRDVDRAAASVTALSPQATLDRGYAIVQDAPGAVVRSAAATQDGDELHVRLADGGLDVSVLRAATGTRTAPA